jgi:hypothetical protein
MNKPGILSPFWERASKDEKLIDFYPTPSDSTHFIVSRYLVEGMEKIGHVYVEFEGDEFKYVSTNGQGKQLFPPTTDFNLVEIQFERYARFLALQKIRKSHNLSKNLIHNINLKNTNTMKTQTNNKTQEVQKNENQMLFIEYSKPTKDGHFITVGDKYKNTIARIHKSFNEETKKYEYVAFDHAGNLMMKNEKLWELKNEFVKNGKELLEQAHQRRIASKEKSKETVVEKSNTEQVANKTEERKNEMEKIRQGNTGIEKQNEKSEEKSDSKAPLENNNVVDNEKNQFDEREQELDDLRNDKDDDRGDMDMDR